MEYIPSSLLFFSAEEQKLHFEINLKIYEMFNQFNSEIENLYNYSSALKFIDSYFESINNFLPYLKSFENKLPPFLYRSLILDVNNTSNDTDHKFRSALNKTTSNYPSDDFVYNPEKEMEAFESLSCDVQRKLVIKIEKYNRFFLNAKILKLMNSVDCGDYFTVANKTTMLMNHFKICYDYPELLYHIEEDDIQIILQATEEWDKIEHTFVNEIPILVLPTINYNQALAFYHYYLAFKGNKDNYEIAINYLNDILAFYLGTSTKKKYKKLSGFTKLGQYSYVDIIKFVNDANYVRTKGFYEFKKRDGFFWKNKVYQLDFRLPTRFFHILSIEEIDTYSDNSLKFHLDFFNSCDNLKDFYKKMSQSIAVNALKHDIKTINYNKINGFPKSPYYTTTTTIERQIIDSILEEINKTLNLDKDLGSEIIIASILDSLLSETILDEEIISVIVVHLIKNIIHK